MICKIRKWDLADAFAITVDDRVVGSIGVFRQGNIHRQTDAGGGFRYAVKAGREEI